MRTPACWGRGVSYHHVANAGHAPPHSEAQMASAALTAYCFDVDVAISNTGTVGPGSSASPSVTASPVAVAGNSSVVLDDSIT